MYTPWTIDTYATFTGDMYEEMELEYLSEELGRDVTYDDVEWEYNHKKLLEILTKNWIDFTRANILDDIIISIDQDGEPWSPREYNFSTDDCSITFGVNIERLRDWIEVNWEKYQAEKIQSQSGFIWLGDEDETMLEYYLRAKSAEEYTPESYLYDQLDDLQGNGRWSEVIEYTVKD